MLEFRPLSYRYFNSNSIYDSPLEWVYDNIYKAIKEDVAFCKEITLHISPSFYADFFLFLHHYHDHPPVTVYARLVKGLEDVLVSPWRYKIVINPELEIRKYYQDSESFPLMLLDVPAHLQYFLFP
jgi:hypothetical protein